MVFLYVHKRDRKKTWYKIISMHLMLWCNYTSTSFECHTFNIIRTYIISDDYCRLQHSITDTIHYQYAYRLQTYECSAKLCWQIFKFHAKRTVQQTHTHTPLGNIIIINFTPQFRFLAPSSLDARILTYYIVWM